MSAHDMLDRIAAAPRRLLIVEDEANIRELVSLHLESEGYACAATPNGREALDRLQHEPFDVVVLDIMLPGMSGLELCRTIRAGQANRDVPILMLTARGDEADKLAGFNSGADDYLTKPFSMLELSARVGALTRRHRAVASRPAGEARAVIEFDGLHLDPARRSVRVRGREVPVTPHEFRLFYQLAAHRGVVFSRERLLADVWQGEVFVTTRSVDTLVHRLRCKVETDPSQPALILTVWGEGYKLAGP
jgi:DNA-binding response OmpR family regulator